MPIASTRADHWRRVYTTRPHEAHGWYEPDPAISMRLVEAALRRGARSVIDVGGGASFLVDHLLEAGVPRIAVLDIADEGMAQARRRLGARAGRVTWIASDVVDVTDVGTFDVWHDRAVFHFLTGEHDRAAYVALAERTVPVGGTLILAAFTPEAPERCSGLPVRRYDADGLITELGPAFRFEDSERHVHTTPRGVAQEYVYTTFRRDPGPGGRARRPSPRTTTQPIPSPVVGFPGPRYTPRPMDDLYRDYILEHYRRPHNFGVLDDPSASFEGSNPLCGDRITMQVGVRDDVLERVGFTGRGCAISQASASLLTDEVKGKPLAFAADYRADDLLDLLGIDISPARLKCAMLSLETLQKAIEELPAGAAEAEPAG
jgi:NifU-like protein involved in Fe-S cluster formation